MAEIEFDPTKDEANRLKHGVSLADAGLIDLSVAVVTIDDRRQYGEQRFRAYGLIGDRVYTLVFTMRGGIVRAISLRKANGKEMKDYGKSRH
jgi:uncharacterized DUF497 family protein